MKVFVQIMVLFILLFSCKNKNVVEEKHTHEIMSVLIDEFGKPTVPPREMYGLEPFSKSQIDSILDQKEKICLHPKLKITDHEFSERAEYDSEINLLIEGLSNFKYSKTLDLSKIKINRPYELSIVDTLKLKEDRRYVEKNFDKLINFSRISYNTSYTKAVLIVGVHEAVLNGYASLVFLEKKKGKWEIKSVDTFSIS
ncbi:hypothetical protein [Aquimarina pacifica]|uniref:hypothetical protein n=1 Tax=Aquimarina pacifica TaxID=1296415 RepID=UPI000470D034|nr:hypothetical protein [Aquimarina pacifica]